MTTKAIITARPGTRAGIAAGGFESDASTSGGEAETVVPEGAVVKGDTGQLQTLESQGYRVKLLPDTGLLDLGRMRIDTEAETEGPAVPADLELPDELAAEWPHHLVQLVAPPREEWLAGIESRVLEGTLTVFDEACQRQLFRPGETYLGGDRPHVARNEASEPLRFAVTYVSSRVSDAGPGHAVSPPTCGAELR